MKTIADANNNWTGRRTIFLTGEPKYTSVASTIVRDIIGTMATSTIFPESVSITPK
jgi:pantetheine-phosphate adenylyltransferase